jgi:hypothetical protein
MHESAKEVRWPHYLAMGEVVAEYDRPGVVDLFCQWMMCEICFLGVVTSATVSTRKASAAMVQE